MSDLAISCLDVWTPAIRDVVRAAVPGGFSIRFADSYEAEEQSRLAVECDYVLAGWAEVTGAMMAAAPRLRMIQKFGIGVDRVDLPAAEREGIVVAITAGGNASTVAEHTIMLMLAVYRRLPFVDRGMRDGKWLYAGMRERCFQLRGKRVGLIGFGHIGRMVARKLAGFEVEIAYCDPVAAEPEVEAKLGARRVSMEKLLATSDVVSLHCPGGAPNSGLIGARELAAMKRGAILINTARGDLVDEAALVGALESGSLMGAGLDVYKPEPPASNSRLAGFDQVVLTPHTAGSVLDNVESVARHAFGNMERVLRGEPLRPADIVVWPTALRRPAA